MKNINSCNTAGTNTNTLSSTAAAAIHITLLQGSSNKITTQEQLIFKELSSSTPLSDALLKEVDRTTNKKLYTHRQADRTKNPSNSAARSKNRSNHKQVVRTKKERTKNPSNSALDSLT
ncbi:hypothetical protein Dimus_012165 [Dionaea muscipula]